MSIKIYSMNMKTAKEIAGWEYEEPYSIYSFDGSDECIKELMNGTYYYVLDNCNELIGYVCFGPSACVPAGFQAGVYHRNEVIDVGLGMRPDLCGRGKGLSFLKNALDYAESLYKKNTFRLTVASFNKRAIKVYERMGFMKEGSFKRESSLDSIEFQTMILNTKERNDTYGNDQPGRI